MQKQIKDPIELTKEGLLELNAELNELVNDKLPAVIERIAKAREHGDLSENAEYHSARDDQQLLQARIDELQEITNNAKVVRQTTSNSKIGIGSTVVISKLGSKKQKTVTIVGEFEANPTANKVSSASPIGSALMKKKVGDKVTVQAPVGKIEYQIIKLK